MTNLVLEIKVSEDTKTFFSDLVTRLEAAVVMASTMQEVGGNPSDLDYAAVQEASEIAKGKQADLDAAAAKIKADAAKVAEETSKAAKEAKEKADAEAAAKAEQEAAAVEAEVVTPEPAPAAVKPNVEEADILADTTPVVRDELTIKDVQKALVLFRERNTPTALNKLLAKYGAKSLPELKKDKYAEIVSDADLDVIPT